MRVLIAIACLVLGAAAASAADIGPVHAMRSAAVVHYRPVGHPAGQIVLFDWEPGVALRAYWLPPWRDRHYFPFGRYLRHARAHWKRPRPAQDYHRRWAVSSVFDLPPPYWAPPLPAPRPPIVAK